MTKRHHWIKLHSIISFGAIQIIRDTLGGGGQQSVTKWHKGEGGGLPKSHVAFWALFLNFGLFSKVFRTLFLEKLKCQFTRGGGGVRTIVTKWHRGRGVKNQPKKCDVLFENSFFCKKRMQLKNRNTEMLLIVISFKTLTHNETLIFRLKQWFKSVFQTSSIWHSRPKNV
jgi:hypothetical protein